MTVCGEKVTCVCVAAKCPHFKRCCPVVWDKYGRIKQQTNEEWFCQLPTEEKAEKFVILCRNAFEAENYRRKRWKDYQNIDWWKEWLKQPHNHEKE